jgi:carbon-monoxide dehydrogenase medium subunit
VALTLDAELEAQSPRGRRTIPASEFFTGVWSTALADDELLLGVRMPVWEGRCGFAIEELARRHGDFALAGATVAVELDGDDRVTRCGIGLLGMDSVPRRGSAAEAEAVGRTADELDALEVGRTAVADLDNVPADLHAPEDYRRRVGAQMVARAWTRAVEEARRG